MSNWSSSGGAASSRMSSLLGPLAPGAGAGAGLAHSRSVGHDTAAAAASRRNAALALMAAHEEQVRVLGVSARGDGEGAKG